MGRRDSLLARSIVETCRYRYLGSKTRGCNLTFSYYTPSCPFHQECPRKPEPADESCFEAILAWMDESDPASELGPGELKAVPCSIKIVSADRPDTREGEDKACLHHYSMLLNKLARAVSLPGSPTYAQCVDEAIRIINEWQDI